MAKPATHKGHCQACGRLQMLPAGVMSKHGYKVTYGYFSGVCPGANSLPFEQSCDLVKRFVALAAEKLASVEELQASLRTTPSEPSCWMHVYQGVTYGAGRRGKSSYAWELVTLRAEVHQHTGGSTGDFRSLSYMFTDSRGKEHGGVSDSIYGPQPYEPTWKGQTDTQLLLETCRRYNAKKADWLEHEASSLRRYIAWQTERVASWKPADLLPVAHADREGFAPTDAPY